MNWIEIKNLQTVPLSEIPRPGIDEFRNEVIQKVKSGNRLVQFFGNKNSDKIILYAVIADDDVAKLFVSSMEIFPGGAYNSITPDVPSAHLFEREIFEQYGIKPEGHPWLKPVRKGIAGIDKAETQYEYFSMSGDEVHEVGVGPIHAGIIEPGHFRFSCHGEKVYHLEIKLGFQHRGVEDLFVRNNSRIVYLEKLAESIAGDTVIGHAETFAGAMESLAGISVPYQVKIIRAIALELERIAIHLGDLSALSGDIAYLTGNSVFGALRTKVINTTMAVCGNRFGRGLIKIGGVNFSITQELSDKILETLNKLDDETVLAAEVLFSSASVLERFEKTGIVETEVAKEIGMVGPAARASGVAIDIRSDHPSGAYEYFPHHKLTLSTGDVFARAYIRFVEIQQSIKIIKEQLQNLPETAADKTGGGLNRKEIILKPDSLVVSLTEGWRGEIAHVLLTDKSGKIERIKIKDPSFNNWFGLTLAVRNEGISDFPICNKSFDLSYSGYDL
ncbi:MAG: NADH-quinone oxidoreductase subunit C [Ignavibacteriaceae bacterium]|nr:NADH-quinone oxidoreductase subunit C [Ignavibacteriaceae bacterium]